ncbi:MAG: hypothetical protein MPK75_10505 [Alphaproteobacteria bacterium]|nr:hypothetical protein [Alphaproteobacteria bacterium]
MIEKRLQPPVRNFLQHFLLYAMHIFINPPAAGDGIKVGANLSGVKRNHACKIFQALGGAVVKPKVQLKPIYRDNRLAKHDARQLAGRNDGFAGLFDFLQNRKRPKKLVGGRGFVKRARQVCDRPVAK